MKNLQENPALRVLLILIFFLGGLFMLFKGFSMTGQMSGLLMMVFGVALLVVSLFFYNKGY